MEADPRIGGRLGFDIEEAGSTFRVSDGTVARGPATAPQPNFRTRIADGTLQACLPGAG